jgi:ubiquinone/menaquinone biosynthesis C-methylase UbiE
MSETRANTAQIDYWNDLAGNNWTDMQEQLDSQLLPYAEAVFGAAAVKPGEHGIDVGCGCGATTLELARRVGPGGEALGIDVSSVMLERARSRAREAGLANARFECADAQTHPFTPARFDLLISRFGVMFFDDPPTAFNNLRRALKPGGRLAFVCWQAGASNPWMLLPTMAVMQHVTIEAPADPLAPGPFAFADVERVRGILEQAGFTNVKADAFLRDMVVGGGPDVEDALRMLMRLGPASRALAQVDAATRKAAIDAVREVLAPFQTADGVRMASAAWVVTARA